VDARGSGHRQLAAGLVCRSQIWVRYVRGIVISIRDLLSKCRDLNLKDDADMVQRHKLVTLALGWRRFLLAKRFQAVS